MADQKYISLKCHLKKGNVYTLHIWGSFQLSRDENYPPQVMVKDMVENKSCEQLVRKRDPRSATKLFFFTQPVLWHRKRSRE